MAVRDDIPAIVNVWMEPVQKGSAIGVAGWYAPPVARARSVSSAPSGPSRVGTKNRLINFLLRGVPQAHLRPQQGSWTPFWANQVDWVCD